MSASRQFKADVAEKALHALYLIGEDTLGKAQRGAPLDEGTLRASGALTIIVNGLRTDSLPRAIAEARRLAAAGGPLYLDVEVSFNTPYAARQEVETDWQHPKGGQAHYLSEPFNQSIVRALPILEAAINR